MSKTINCGSCKAEISRKAPTCPQCGHPNKVASHLSGKETLMLLVPVVLVLWWFSSNSTSSSPSPSHTISAAERYPGPWQESFHLAITKTLAQNDIRGCGQYKYKASVKDNNEYVVYCTIDGKSWLSYTVWPSINQVQGPHAPEPSLK